MSLKICRSCLCESNEMKNILNIDLKLSELDKIKFIDCYNAITDVYIQDNETTTSSMPTTICEKCENDLIFSYKFRLQCQKSDQELKLRFVVKTETAEVEDIVLEPIVEINFELESSSDSEELRNDADSSEFSEEDIEEDVDFESEPCRSSKRIRSRRKDKIEDKTMSNNENVSLKKALHLSILNCEDAGDIKAIFKCIHCDEVSIFIS